MRESESSLETSGRGAYEYRLGDELRGERATLGRSLLDVQRDLRIKAAYIAAIEDCEPDVFPNPSFVAGYVRSYARYLGLDPDEVYARFCDESGFAGSRGAAAPARRAAAADEAAGGSATARAGAGTFRPDFPLAERRGRRLPDLSLSAIGSVLMLLGLICGLGYGGWVLLQNIQRVQFAPVDEVPVAFAEIDPFAPPEAEAAGLALPELASPVAATALVDLYRQQELEVPILVPRDGPIAAIDPDKIGVLARARPETAVVASTGPYYGPGAAAADSDAAAAVADEPRVTETPERPRLTVLAERPAWIRVYLENGTIIFERILESGEIYVVPEDLEQPRVWAGNSGSVYVRVDDVLRGPIGSGTRAVRDVVLEAEAIAERFAVVEEVPAVISEAISNLALQSGAALIQ